MLRPNGTEPRTSGGFIARQRSFTDSEPNLKTKKADKQKKLIRVWSAQHDAFYLYDRETGATVWEGASQADEDNDADADVTDITNDDAAMDDALRGQQKPGDMLRTASEPPIRDTLIVDSCPQGGQFTSTLLPDRTTTTTKPQERRRGYDQAVDRFIQKKVNL